MSTLEWRYDATFDQHVALGDSWRTYTVTQVEPHTWLVTCDFVQGKPQDHARLWEVLADTLETAQAYAQARENTH